jgi:hypothetical protein
VNIFERKKLQNLTRFFGRAKPALANAAMEAAGLTEEYVGFNKGDVGDPGSRRRNLFDIYWR